MNPPGIQIDDLRPGRARFGVGALLPSMLCAWVLAGPALGLAADAPPVKAGPAGAVPLELTKQNRPKTRLDQHLDKLDPTVDGWDTEAFNDAAAKPLKALAKLIEHSAEMDPAVVAKIVTEDFACQKLRPQNLKPGFSDGTFSSFRAEDTGERALQRLPSDYQGAAGLMEAIRELTVPSGHAEDIRSKFKLFQVEQAGAVLTTRIYFEVSSRGAESGIQQNATWRCQWVYPQLGQEPRLKWIGLERYEEVVTRASQGKLFVDVTASALGQNKSYRDQVLPGINYWLNRITRLQDFSKIGHHGIALGDVNGDGLEDLYMCDAGGLPNRLFLQNPDGTLTDKSAESGADWLENSTGALLVDLDNDGAEDLVVAARPFVLVARNDGQGHFTLMQVLRVVADPMSLAAADYDNDGLLDVYVCGYQSDSTFNKLANPVPYDDANNGGRNALLHNDGQFRFTDVTEQTGLNTNNTRYSFAAVWEDFDNDGDLDLYVANDFGRNNLYRNDGGRFTDVAAQAGVEDIGSGMSVSWADYNRDGLMDVYIGNMFSSAGNRIAYQRKFAQNQSSESVQHLQRMARGNTLFQNAGDGTFRDRSEEAAVTMGRWSWGSRFVDLNNDGWQDLVVANGYLTGDDTRDL